MKTYTKEELANILDLHRKWMNSAEGGQRADLHRADLQGAYLRGAYLQGADLQGAYLQRAYLRGADLQGAYLRGADLQGAYLRGAYLQGADLQGAYLRGADLRGADLQRADLQGAVHRWSQVAFRGHGECGRMLTALIYEEGQEAIYQCGCFYGSLDKLKAYIDNGSEAYKASRTLAMETATTLLNI